jgi:hypothetical protein
MNAIFTHSLVTESVLVDYIGRVDGKDSRWALERANGTYSPHQLQFCFLSGLIVDGNTNKRMQAQQRYPSMHLYARITAYAAGLAPFSGASRH